jgi:NAD(P)-dependent dehydrogenase (short-subunit alcohol dehydrogenase family)
VDLTDEAAVAAWAREVAAEHGQVHVLYANAAVTRFAPVEQLEEVAMCALFLASDEASYVTGANLMVDGGWSAVLPG